MAVKQAFSTTDGITDLLYVATHINLCCADIPSEFTFTYSILIPTVVQSPNEVFGIDSTYEFKDLFVGFYDQVNKTWTDNNTVVPAEVKADVFLQQTDYDLYLSLLDEWNYGYREQRQVEYRKHMAQKLIDACA